MSIQLAPGQQFGTPSRPMKPKIRTTDLANVPPIRLVRLKNSGSIRHVVGGSDLLMVYAPPSARNWRYIAPKAAILAAYIA